MGIEIERKFLVGDDRWRAAASAAGQIRQGWLCSDPGRTVRVRQQTPLDGAGSAGGWITVKGRTEGLTRAEYEYAIPEQDAAELLALCSGALVEKERWLVPTGVVGLTWEVDVFLGANAGLVVAELEVPDEATAVPAAPWLGREVSGDSRYANVRLAVDPWPWKED